MSSALQTRVDSLETLLGEFLVSTGAAFLRMERETAELKREMSDFKKEMSDFKNEMSEFKKEMSDFKNESNKRWGDLANKLGTFVEDIAAPNVPWVAESQLGLGASQDFSVRRSRRHPTDKSRILEVDILSVHGSRVVVCEAKSATKKEYIDEYLAKLVEFGEFFTELRGLIVVPLFASTSFSEPVLAYLTKKQIHAMAFREGTMGLVNKLPLPDST